MLRQAQATLCLLFITTFLLAAASTPSNNLGQTTRDKPRATGHASLKASGPTQASLEPKVINTRGSRKPAAGNPTKKPSTNVGGVTETQKFDPTPGVSDVSVDGTITVTDDGTDTPSVQPSKLPMTGQPSKPPVSGQSSKLPASVQPSDMPVSAQSSKLPASGQPSSTNRPVGTDSTKPCGSKNTDAVHSTAQPTLPPTTEKLLEDYVLSGTVLCEKPTNAWLDLGSQVEVLDKDGSIYVKNQTNSYGQFRLHFNRHQLHNKNPSIVLRVQGKQCSGQKVEVHAAVDLSGNQLEYKFSPLLLHS